MQRKWGLWKDLDEIFSRRQMHLSISRRLRKKVAAEIPSSGCVIVSPVILCIPSAYRILCCSVSAMRQIRVGRRPLGRDETRRDACLFVCSIDRSRETFLGCGVFFWGGSEVYGTVPVASCSVDMKNKPVCLQMCTIPTFPTACGLRLAS